MKIHGSTVKTLRNAIGLSTRTLAARIGKTCMFISLLERDLSGASPETLARLAETLEVPIEVLKK